MVHLHTKFNFTKSILETVKESLRHSCRTIISGQGISLPLYDQSYRSRLLKLKFEAMLLPFIYQHRTDVRLYTSCLHFAKSCVFNKQSLLLISVTL